MLICGINSGHNGSAALIRDGKILSALQEERISRVKNFFGFPSLSIDRLLKMEGASFNDVDAFVFGGKETYLPFVVPDPDPKKAKIRAYKSIGGLSGQIRRIMRKTPLRTLIYRQRLQKRIEPLLTRGIPREKIHLMEHHRCHATTAYYGQEKRSDVLVMTLDGSGDGLCGTVSIPDEHGNLNRVSELIDCNSLGHLWAIITSHMGMVPLEHEYKMMGMAPYADKRRARKVADLFNSGLSFKEGRWYRGAGVPETIYSYNHWRSLLEFVRFDDLCAGLQLFTEEVVTNWVKYWLKKTRLKALLLSGGVFMNVKLNHVISDLDEVEQLFVFPSCGDETNAIGAAWAYLEDLGKGEQIEPIHSMYLGVPPNDKDYEDTKRLAISKGYPLEEPANLSHRIAELLAAGEIVARCEGREEFGARALGNRSLLADPSRPESVGVLNRAIKNRDFWMPFACTVLDKEEERYIDNPKGFSAPYMILAFNSRSSKEIAAGIHPQDLTIRPQVLKKTVNAEYYDILEHYSKITGRGALLNTSFNLHGEPIVSTPHDALDVFERSGLKHLSLKNIIVHKQDK